MENKKINNNELNNVSGGQMDEDQDVVVCPSCGSLIEHDKAYVREEKDGCSVIVYFRCPECTFEWHS